MTVSTTSTPMFIAALFTKVKMKNQLVCPSVDEWKKEIMLFLQNECYSVIKKEQNPMICK
jgi:hypothetical protein